jgi:hypothetical protein
MKRSDIIGKKIEIYKAKMLLFVAIAGGSWIYAFKFSETFFTISLLAVFIISAIGIFNNVFKLSDLDRKLERIEND